VNKDFKTKACTPFFLYLVFFIFFSSSLSKS
jgi:hypothetical protein